MRRLLQVVAVLAIAVVALGFYLGWFQFSTTSGEQKTNVTLTVNTDRIKQDENKAAQKLKESWENLKKKNDGDGSKNP